MSNRLEQERAKFAMDKVLNHGLGDEDKKKYATLIRKLPSMVMHNGIGQSLSYLLADDEGNKTTPSWKLYTCLNEWICEKMKIYNPRNDLITSLINGSREEYLYTQKEALYLLTWMVKFADAYLPKGGE